MVLYRVLVRPYFVPCLDLSSNNSYTAFFLICWLILVVLVDQ